MYGANVSITFPGDTALYAVWGLGVFNLTVTKTVSGAFGDRTKGFLFTISFQNASGVRLAAGTQYAYTGGIIAGSGASAPANGTLTLDADGKATVTLMHGQAIHIKEVAYNYYVTIQETTDALYTASFKDSEDAGVTSGANTWRRSMTAADRQFDFTNTRITVTPTGIRMNDGGVLLPGVLVIVFTADWVAVSVLRRRRKRRNER